MSFNVSVRCRGMVLEMGGKSLGEHGSMDSSKLKW